MYNVLSLFDGLSGAQLALRRAGIEVNNYFAAEIDPYAIKVTQANFPNTIQLGDVTKIKGKDLPKIDLLVGGSPCQGFSFSGKKLNFKDPRSKLFFEYVRIYRELREINPDIKFVFENVDMELKHRHKMSSFLGVPPFKLNSSLVSAQNRERLYWTNIEVTKAPKDRGVVVADILETPLSDCLKDGEARAHFESIQNQLSFRNDEFYYGPRENGIIFLGGFKGCRRIHDGKKLSRNFREGSRIYSINGKSSALTAKTKGNQGGYSGMYGDFIDDLLVWRQLTITECERLQNLPCGYTDHVSETQRFKMVGNGFTVDIFTHLFSFIESEKTNTVDTGFSVLSLFDGLAGARIALEKEGFEVSNYFASEIDEYAIKVAKANYPDITHLGDVTKIDTSKLPKIDLLIGGSPCQGFSLAGDRLNFNDERSKLFFEYVRILKELRAKNPNILFLLENVKMKKWCENIITKSLGVRPIEINSALVSAQNRPRLYWTNIPVTKYPKNKRISLRSILERHVSKKYKLSPEKVDRILNEKRGKGFFSTVNDKKIGTLIAGYRRRPTDGIYIDDGFKRALTPLECERLQTIPDNYTKHVSNSRRYKMIGNGFTVDVIAHILSFINIKNL